MSEGSWEHQNSPGCRERAGGPDLRHRGAGPHISPTRTRSEVHGPQGHLHRGRRSEKAGPQPGQGEAPFALKSFWNTSDSSYLLPSGHRKNQGILGLPPWTSFTWLGGQGKSTLPPKSLDPEIIFGGVFTAQVPLLCNVSQKCSLQVLCKKIWTNTFKYRILYTTCMEIITLLSWQNNTIIINDSGQIFKKQNNY